MTNRKPIALCLVMALFLILTACWIADSAKTPSLAGTPSPGGEDPGEIPGQDGGTDLQAFYEGLLAKYGGDGFNPDMPVEGDFLKTAYPDLSGIALKQRVIYQPMISSVVCDIALAETEDAGDVQAVKDAFQARIDTQVGTDDAPGGAWYPESIEGWRNGSCVVSHGNYVMMVAWEGCDRVVEDFDALF